MIERGWCWNRVDECLSNWTVTGFIASLLPSHETRMHLECTARRCSLQASTLDQLKAKHISTCNGECSVVEFDESELVLILENGGNPGILRHDTESGDVSFEIVNALDYPFVAISHVW